MSAAWSTAVYFPGTETSPDLVLCLPVSRLRRAAWGCGLEAGRTKAGNSASIGWSAGACGSILDDQLTWKDRTSGVVELRKNAEREVAELLHHPVWLVGERNGVDVLVPLGRFALAATEQTGCRLSS